MDVQAEVSFYFQHSRAGVAHGKQSAALRWVAHLGMPGVFAVSAIDASVFPLAIPGSTDLLLLWLISHRGNPWALVACALAGSLLGAYTTWHLGKKGGEAAFKRFVSPRMQNKVQGWSQKHPILAVFLPAVLPPPIPLWPFLLAAGALGVTWQRFLAAFGAGRALRYGAAGWFAVKYGRRIVELWAATLDKWSAPILWTFGLLSVAGFAYSVWKLRRLRAKPEGGQVLESSAAD